METERRAHPRFSSSVPAGFRFPNGTPSEGWGRITDLSAGGVILESRFSMKVGSVLYLTFTLHDGARFDNLRARVLRVSFDDGYFVTGIAFDSIVDTETLRDVIAALAYEGGLK